MALDPSIVESVANGNFKNFAEMGIVEAMGHQSRLNAIKEASIGQIVNRMNSVDPIEARALGSLARSAQPAEAQANALAAALAQILTKAGQTTPPVTAPPPAGG